MNFPSPSLAWIPPSLAWVLLALGNKRFLLQERESVNSFHTQKKGFLAEGFIFKSIEKLNQEHIILQQERKSIFLAHWRRIFLQGFLLAHINSRSEELLQQGGELRIGLSQFRYEFFILFFFVSFMRVYCKVQWEKHFSNFSIDWQRRKKYPIVDF